MSTEFKGLTAVVTGAGSGIGLAVARLLSESGAKVLGLDLNEGEMSKYATFIPCDVSNPSNVSAAFAEIAKHTDVIDVLANNAGVGAIGSITDAKEEEWQKVFGVNVFGMGRVSAAAMPMLKKSKFASIVNTCSIAATAGLPQRAVYSASKGAVLSLTLAMAADGIPDKVRVNCVAPGTADTPWVSRLLSQAADPVAERAALEARQPMGRLVSADEVASAIVYLASPRQASTTGTVLNVDGGMQGLRLRK
ncbi:MAG: SDR family oxidoreductase [Actinomycetota bacterium]|jgi:2-keto-3-deoxy-L-fuconate dehydrogenase